VREPVLVKISGRNTDPAAAPPSPSDTASSPVVHRGRSAASGCSAGSIGRVAAATGVAALADIGGEAGDWDARGTGAAHAAAPITTPATAAAAPALVRTM
jgi:hypothetical protein